MSISKVCLLDIETTGLSKENDEIVCIGLFSLATKQLNQWIRSSTQNECQFLQQVLPQLLEYETFYLAGQNAFDMEFLITKLKQYELVIAPPSWTCISLFKLPFFKRLQSWGIKKRSQLESTLGYQRECSSSGKEIAKLGKLLCTSRTPLYEEVILSHNKEELLSCFYLYSIYDLIRHLPKLPHTFSRSDQVIFQYITPDLPLNDFVISGENLTISLDTTDHLLTLIVPITLQKLKRFLHPAKDYFYVPSEGQLIHRSLAQFIPASMREKVSSDNCFISQETLYVPLYMRDTSKSAYWLDDEKNCYLPLSELSSDEVLLSPLIKYLTQG